MFDKIQQTLESDVKLEILFSKAREYADVYLLAKKRQKGCDGLGEMTNLKDEFKGILDELVEYCKNKKYITGKFSYDIDLMADEINNLIKK